MRARDMENERLLTEIGQLWAEAERIPNVTSDFALSAEALERIVERVTSSNDGGVAAVQPERLDQHRRRRGWRPLGIAALAALTMAGAVGLLTLRHQSESRGVLAPEVRAAAELILSPVEYRISPNTSTLVGDAPELTLEVASVPGSKVEIAGQSVGLDSTGHGEARVKVDAADLFGESDVIRTKEQVIGYSVETPSGNRYRGDLTAKIGVTPLYLDESKTKIVTTEEQARIVGCTSQDANLWITHWSQIPLDARGCFDVPLPMDSPGYSRVTLRATQAGLAPRFVSLTLKRLAPERKPLAKP